MLIELMIALHRALDIEVLEQQARCAGIFSQDQGHPSQHREGSEGNIFEVPYRCRDEYQLRHKWDGELMLLLPSNKA